MSKKKKALQISALLTAVSGATLLVASGSSAVKAAEIRTVDERCWDQQPTTPREYRLNNCDFLEYGLVKADGTDSNSNAPQNDVNTPGTGGGAGGPDPVDPYQP